MDSINELIEHAIVEMRKFYPGKKSQKNYRGGFMRLKRYYFEHNATVYSKQISVACVNEHLLMYKANNISESTFKCVRKAVSLLDMFVETGKMEWIKELPVTMQALPDSLDKHINEYRNYCFEKGILSSKSIKTHINYIRSFSAYLVTKGCYRFEEIDSHTLYEHIIEFLKTHYSNKGGFLTIMRSFLQFLRISEITNEELSAILPERVSTARKKILEGFTDNELNRIVNAIETTTALGKRNYAIIMLAVETGLRGIDVINLKITDILWTQYKIELIQHKTNKPLSLPVSIHTLNAIADYILNARPVADDPSVFLRSVRPYTALSPGTPGDILQKYLDISNVEHHLGQYRGFHSLRRSVGARMLGAGIPVHTISEILGHSGINSTKPYISVHTDGLKTCAIDLNGLRVEEGALK